MRRRTFLRTSTSRIHRFFNRRNSIFGGVAALIVVFGLLFAPSPSAQGYSVSDTNQILTTTGGGGLIGPSVCGTGSVIYGLGGGGNSGATSITEPVAYCANLNDAATTQSTGAGTLGGSGWGGASNYGLTSQYCSSTQALVGVVAHKQSNGYVSGFQIICGTLPGGTARVTSSSVFGWSNGGTSSPSQRETIECPTGMIAVGMLAYVGAIMDRIGFRCGTISSATQAGVTLTSITGTFGSTVALTASGGTGSGVVSFAVTATGTAGCSISGTTLSATAAGTCTVTATKAADTNYSAASSSATTVTFNRLNQTVTFTNPGTKERSTTPFAVAPTASSGLTVSIASSTTSVCTTSGLNITMVTTGTCTIGASQSGNGNYNTATDVTNSFTIQDTTAPTLSSASFTSTAGADNTYIAGDTILATFNFSEAVNVTGTPTVTFLVGATNRTASYVSGTGTTALVFSYTVVSGDNDIDGVTATTSTLTVAGGTIRDAASNNATLTFAGIAASLSHLVDTTAPTVTMSRSGSGTIISGQTVTVTFTFSESVTGFDASDIQRCPSGPVGGSFGTMSGSGASYSVVFTPTADLWSGNPCICIGPGAVADTGGNVFAALSSTLNINVDTRLPTVTAFASSTADGTYAIGGTVNISATTSEGIQSGNTLTVTLNTGATVTLTAASIGTSLTATYTVGVGQSSSDLTISSFTVGTVLDAAGNAMTSTTVPSGASNIAGAKAIVIDGILPTVTAFSSSTADGTFAIGGTVNISAVTSEAIQSGNTLTVTLETGVIDRTVLLTAASVSTSLSGTYTVQSGDTTSDLTVSSFTIGTVADTAGNAMTSTAVPSGTSNIAGAKAIVIDGVLPTVTAFASSTADGTYAIGGTVNISATTSETIQSGNTLTVTLETGVIDRTVLLTAASASTSLSGTYTVQSGDTTSDLTVASFTIGTVADTAGNAMTSTAVPSGTSNIAGAKAIVIDGVLPTVTIGASSSSLRSGQTSSLTFTLSEAATNFVVGDITVSGGTLSLFTGVSSTSYTVVFTPTAHTQSGSDSVSVALGTFTDAAGNNNTASSTTTITYDTLTPTVSNVISSSTNGTFTLGDSVSIQVVLSEAVTVTGTPKLTLETGSTDRTVDYVSGSGTTTLTFTYTVQSGDSSPDLDYVSVSALALNGGTIVDAATNAATLTLPVPGAAGSLAANKAIVVTSAPTKVMSVRTPVGTASGAAFTTQPQVSLQDSGSNVVTIDSSTVVTASVSAGATLVGTQTATAASGVATFSNLGISGTVGSAYTVTYSATYGGNALTVATQSVTPTVGAATQIAITTQPVGDTAGAALSTQPIVKILDSGSNVVTTASVSIEVSASGGTLGGTATVSTSSGVATYTNLTFAGTENTNYTLTFAATGYTSQTSSNFSVGVGAATKLVLTTSAATAKYGQAFTTQPVVKVQDAGSNVVTTSSAVVTASLSGGTVVGTGNATSSSGVATFSGLGITGAPGSYTVTYSSGSLATASQVITVNKADQTVAFADPADRAWLASTFVLSPTASSGLTATLTSSTTSVCTLSALTVTMLRDGTCTLTAAQSGSDNYNAATSVTQSFLISLAAQATLSISSSTTISYGSFMTLATSGGSSTAVVSYGVTGACTISGTALTATGNAAATCVVTATKAGDTQYAQTTATQTVTIARSPSNSITFGSLADRSWSASTFMLSPTATSGDTPALASTTTGVCTVSSMTITMVSSGSCSLTASEDGNGNYLAATDVVRSFEISRVTPSTATWTDVTAIYGSVDQSISPPTVSFGGVTVGGSWTYSSADASVVALSSAIMDFGLFGSTTITGSFAPTDTGKYNSVVATLNVSVGKIRPLFSWVNVSKIYGDASFSLTAPTVTNGVAGSWLYSSAMVSVISTSGSTATVVGAGSSTITAAFTPTDATNYVSGGTVAMTVAVEKATPTFGWAVATAIFGDANRAITAPTVATTAATGSWAYSSAATSVVAISGSDLDFGNVGSSVITATFTPTDAANYVSGGTVTMTATVGQADQAALSVASTHGTYGTSLTLLTSGGTTNGSVLWLVVDGSATSCAVTSGALSALTIGTCTVTGIMAGDTNYKSVTSSATTVTFAQRSITVTADNKNKIYGEIDPSLTYAITTGSMAGLDTLTGSLTRSAGASANNYSITQGSLANANYAVTFVPGTLTVGRKPITVTAANQTKQYGEVDPAPTYSITNGATLVAGDSFAGALSRAGGSGVGTHAIQQGTLGLSSNYTLTFVGAALTIETRNVTVTADVKTKQYGEVDPAFTYLITNGAVLVAGDSFSGALARNSGSGVGAYAITQGTLALSANYNLTYVSANLTIDAKPITVTANSLQTKVYGESDPTFQYGITSGSLVAGDSLTGSLSRSSGSTVGTYAISIGTLVNSNYNVSFVSANFAITTKPITITATARTKVYGQADPTLVFTITNGQLVGSDSLSGSLARVSGDNVGTYAIAQGTVANSNYAITYVGANLTIERSSQNALSVTTSQITYGTSVVLGSNGGSGTGVVTYTVSSAGSAGCSITDSTLAATGNVGTTCTVAVTKAQSANHNEATSAAVTITVINRAITVTATSVRKNYGDADPDLAYTVTSGAMVAGDTLTGSLNRAGGESVGTYLITQGTLANSNYTITYIGASVTVDPRPITVRAVNKTKVFGQADPQLTQEITGGNLIGSDVLNGSISRNSGENIGSYAIGRGNLAHSSYSITFIDAILSVTGVDQSGFTLVAVRTSITLGDSTTLSTGGGNGDGAVTYAVTDGTGRCTILSDTITADAAGTCVVTATKAQQGNYNRATSNNLTINISRRTQVITFARPADRNFTTASFSPAPTVDSGIAIALASQTTNVCTVSGLSVTVLNSGTCTLDASVGATSNYNAAAGVTQSFVISPVVPFAPTLNSLTASDGAISAGFALGSSGGSALLNHEYSLDNGTTWAAWPTGSITSPLNIGRLTNGVEYQVMVRALNIVGPGAASNMLAVTPVMPIVVPAAAAPTTPVESTSTTVVSSSTTIFVVTTVTRNPDTELPTTTVARRAVTTTIFKRNGDLTTTTTTRITTTTTTGLTATTVERNPASAQRAIESTTQTTVQTRTSVFESFSPLAPVTRVPDTIPPTLAPTKSAAVVDGFVVSMDIRRVNNEQVVATLGESTMTLTLTSMSDNGAPEPLLTNGSIAVTAGGSVRVSGTGMLPTEPIEVWMYSTPVKLGEVIAAADGSFSAELVLPSDVALGAHKIQFVGKKVDGAGIIFAQGISVVDDTVLMMNRNGELHSAIADNLSKDNVVSISTMNKDDAANLMLWFLVIMILIAGLLAAQPRRTSVAFSLAQRIETATPWLIGMKLPRILMLLVGMLAGFGAANSAGFSVTAPSTLWVAVLIIIGLLDVMAGGLAGLVFATSMVANGAVGSTQDVRIMTLVVLIATLPNVIGRAGCPQGARFALQATITVVLNVVVVASLVSLFAPVGGVKYELSAWFVELSWVAAIAAASRFGLLRVTQRTNDQYGTRMPALRVAGVIFTAAFVVGTNIATIWTLLAIVVLAVVVFFGLRIHVGLSVQHVWKVFVASIAASLVLVIAATETSVPQGSREEITEASQMTPISEANVIGQLDVSIDGYPRTFVAINTGVGEITFVNGATGQSLTIESWSKDNERIPLVSGKTLHLVSGEHMVIRANGYAANETMDAWLFSNPVFVGNASTNGDGKLETRFIVPVGKNDGMHTLQIRLVGEDGNVVSYSIPAMLSSVMPNVKA